MANPSVRERCLDEARTIVCGSRDKQYGGPEQSFKVIADLWSTYLGFKGLTPRDVGIMMALMKIARISTSGGKSWDSYIDLAGYAACAMECQDAQERGCMNWVDDSTPDTLKSALVDPVKSQGG